MSTTTKAALADMIGLAAVALASGAALAALNRTQALNEPWVVWLIALPFLVLASLWLWRVSKKTRDWDINRWVGMLIATLLIGAISFAIDVLVGSSNGHYNTFLEAAAHAGSPFGFPLTVLICPVGTLVAFGSWIRCVILRVLRCS